MQFLLRVSDMSARCVSTLKMSVQLGFALLIILMTTIVKRHTL